tara:strand:- start:280 stop:501 length:222 start_codon:yes stop_codon:yes gene_type:complete
MCLQIRVLTASVRGSAGIGIKQVSAIFAVIGSSEALDQQKTETNATETHIPGQNDEKADGQTIAELGGHGGWA